MGREVTPKIRHIDNREDLRLFRRLLKKFANKMADQLVDQIQTFKGWKQEENLAQYRKQLVQTVQEACLERKDPVTNSLQKQEVDRRNDPYVKAALLSMLIDYHIDEQLQQIEGIIGDL